MTADHNRRSLVEVIDRPLGFYVLALLIVESFIGAVAAVGRSSEAVLQWGLGLGVGMFVYITITVTVIVWNKAHVLTFDRDAHLTERELGTDEGVVEGPEQLSSPTETRKED